MQNYFAAIGRQKTTIRVVGVLASWVPVVCGFRSATNEKTAMCGGSLVTWWAVLFFFPIGAGALLACNFIVLGAVPQVPAASLCEFAIIANVLNLLFYSLVHFTAC